MVMMSPKSLMVGVDTEVIARIVAGILAAHYALLIQISERHCISGCLATSGDSYGVGSVSWHYP